MKSDLRFRKFDKRFWANVRTISEALGYTNRATKQIQVYSIDQIERALTTLGLQTHHLVTPGGGLTSVGEGLLDYFVYRADVLNNYVEPRLMDLARAVTTFNELKDTFRSVSPVPMNKQKGDKRKPAYLTGIVNMLIEAHSDGLPCDYDPKKLTSFTQSGIPLRTLARRVDGCFPGCVNPIAVWEIKEYYHTTTFGSRVADGIFESLLDGLELEELRLQEGIDVQHLLIVDAYYTWWQLGRSYLCRIIDMLHMGYIDEVLFGYEVIERLPQIVADWVILAKNRG